MTAATPEPAGKPDPLELFKSFLADHPEIVPELLAAAGQVATAPADPLTYFGVVHELIDAYRAPIDDERRAQMHSVVDDHAAEHAELVARAGASAASGDAPAPAPASEPAVPASPGTDGSGLPLDGDPGEIPGT